MGVPAEIEVVFASTEEASQRLPEWERDPSVGILVAGDIDTLAGLDLVSVPQAMIARPLVAGPIAGAMLGDVVTGLELGVLFELFQYDILPMGATRYPEYGPATG